VLDSSRVEGRVYLSDRFDRASFGRALNEVPTSDISVALCSNEKKKGCDFK
jgi:hypothetical protein